MISGDIKVIANATKLVLPGVGAFDAGMNNLEQSHLIPLLNKKTAKCLEGVNRKVFHKFRWKKLTQEFKVGSFDNFYSKLSFF